MTPLTHLKNKTIGVFGLGKAGQATVDALLAGGAKVFAWDDAVVSGQSSVVSKYTDHRTLTTDHYNAWPWPELSSLVLSPGVPLTHPAPHAVVELAHKHNVEIIGDIELLYRQCPDATYIAITGTNGKSTTTTLIGHIIERAGRQVQVGGNLGTAALSLEPLGKGGIYVIETSSYQLDLLKTSRFNVAVWLNITPDHIDRHGDIDGYIKAKLNIFERQQAGDVAVVAVDDAYSESVARTLMARKTMRVIPVSSAARVSQGVYAEQAVLHDVMDDGHEETIGIQNVAALTGKHNWQNAAAAYAACRAAGLSADEIAQGLASFAGLRHRLQLVTTLNDVRFINDSKATNADATANALAPYDTIYWILGGKPKEGGIRTLANYFPKIRHAFLIGKAADEFAATLEGHVHYTQCGTLAKAFEAAADMALRESVKDAVVLLSPACASFDQWKSFEERGDAFCAMADMLYDKLSSCAMSARSKS